MVNKSQIPAETGKRQPRSETVVNLRYCAMWVVKGDINSKSRVQR